MSLERAISRAVDRQTRDDRIFGVVFAEVKEVKPGGPAPLFVLNYLTLGTDVPSQPARLATMMGGSGRGTYFAPEVGDEVVVAFELGDVGRPVILGALWSDQDQPPPAADLSASNNVRAIVSRAGHTVTLDDTQGQARVVIQTAGGHTVTLDDTAGQAKVELKSAAGLSLTMDDAMQTINITTTGSVATSMIALDSIAWNHFHMCPPGGPSGPPLPLSPVPPPSS
jgi:phage baseplate assembly protein gpV